MKRSKLDRLYRIEQAAIRYVLAQGAADEASVLHKKPVEEQARLAGEACSAYDLLIDAIGGAALEAAQQEPAP